MPRAAGRTPSARASAGTIVAPGSFVDFVISLGLAPVPVPNVLGQTQGAAEATLVAASLTLVWGVLTPAGVGA